ncbi:MAG: MarR family transcriptional regulator [Chloroflexi bacterium]|nr:MarR family transcriptional regulator [Chloroflexota bacterium]
MTESPTRTSREIGLDHPNIDDWRTFLQAHALISRRLDDELRAEQSMSLAEYDALIQLAIAPDRRLRMNQLADRVLLSRSGVTRLVDRLVADGLVARTQCSTDARGAEAVITSAGLDRLRDASRTHLRGVTRYFLEPLSSGELAALGRTLETIVGGLRVQAAADGTSVCDDDTDAPAERRRA